MIDRHSGGLFISSPYVFPEIPKSAEIEIHTLRMTDENSQGILVASEK
jgi:hypothetical protein